MTVVPQSQDAVVVVPGIMGSTLKLAESGKTVWGFDEVGWYAKAWLWRSLDVLRLTEEERNGKYGRIRATSLLDFTAFGPVLNGLDPYTDLVEAIKRAVYHPAAVLSFPYDWRLPVAYNSARLADAAHHHLQSWKKHPEYRKARAERPDRPEPRLVFVAHSMGGLLVRAMTTTDLDVRGVISLGTPYAGAVKAVKILDNGETDMPFPNRKMRDIGRTMPGLYDLLPLFRCVHVDDQTDPARLTAADVAGLGGDVELAATSLSAMAALRGKSFPWPHQVVAGTSQPTHSSLSIANGKLALDERSYNPIASTGKVERDGNGRVVRVPRFGDGTVPVTSAIEKFTPAVLPQQHGPIVTTKEGIEAVRHFIIEGEPKGEPLGDGDLGLAGPDVVETGERWSVRVTGISSPEDARLSIRNLSSGPDATPLVISPGDGEMTAEVEPLPEGIYELTLDGTASSPVRQCVMVTEPSMTDGTGLQLFAIGIGRYQDTNFPTLRVTEEIRNIAKILRPFDVKPSPGWKTPMLARDGDAVDTRLLAWAKSPPLMTVLYWLGHGWSFGDESCALAHSRSQGNANGITPEQLAGPIARWAKRTPAPPGLIVIIDACKSDAFAQSLHAQLNSKNVRVPRLIIGTSDQGSTNLGVFSGFLRSLIDNVYRGQRSINLSDLARQIEALSEPQIFPQQRGIARTDLRASWPEQVTPPAVKKTDTQIVVGPRAVDDHVWTDQDSARGAAVNLEPIRVGGKSTSRVVREIGERLVATWPAGDAPRSFEGLGNVLGGFRDYPGHLILPVEGFRSARPMPQMTDVMRKVARQPGTTVVVTAPAGAVALARRLYTHEDTEEFGKDFQRLVRRRSGFRGLFTALALAEGRGLPLRDGVWIAFANAISDQTGGGRASLPLASQLISAAADYLTTGSENGQTVYRLARSGYDELVLNRAGVGRDVAQLEITRAGLALVHRLAGRRADPGAPPVNAYLRHHLRTHAKQAGPAGQDLLADRQAALERLTDGRGRT